MITSDWSEIDKELKRLSGLPQEDATPLEDTLAQVFAETEGIIHVITGSLKASGKTESDVKADSWEGTMIWGGESPGSVHDPVVYAQYERQRGGEHDFLKHAIDYGKRFPSAILTMFKGGKK